jgi:hypothetical protein
MIHPQLTQALAQANVDDLRRAALARGRALPSAHPARAVPVDASVTLRFASAADQTRLERLAALDSSTCPAPPVLLAEVDGQLLAALALSDGAVVADPFSPTLDLIDLLCARARQLEGNSRTRRSGRMRAGREATWALS